MLAFTGYVKDPETGENLSGIGTVRDIPRVDSLVESGVLEQTNWSGYPLTFLGPASVFAEWVERLPANLFHGGLAREESASSGWRLTSGAEVQARAVQKLRALDPGRRVQVDLWDES